MGKYLSVSSTRPAAANVSTALKTQFCQELAISARCESSLDVNPSMVPLWNSLQKYSLSVVDGNRTVVAALQMASWTSTAAVRPTVPAEAYIQIIGSSSPRREGCTLLDWCHFLRNQAVGRKVTGESRAVVGEAMDVSRM